MRRMERRKMANRRQPGSVRDAIIKVFHDAKRELTVAEIRERVAVILGEEVAASSVRSYLNINTPGKFQRTGRGKYHLTGQ
jgi:hypothetical protein